MKVTTLCYIEKDDSYLMLYRNKKENDQSQGKWLGVGGKMEEGESPDDCIVREVFEETGFRLVDYTCRGFATFLSDVYEDEIMFLYTSNLFEGQLVDQCQEGHLEWIPKNKIMELSLWEGDRIFLKELLRKNNKINIKLVYQGDKLVEYVKY